MRFGWGTMKKNLGFFIGLLVLACGVSAGPSVVGGLLTKEGRLLGFLFQVAGWALSLIVSLGLIGIALRLCDTGERQYADLFSRYRLVFRYLLASVLYVLIVLGGTILLVVPGIIWAIKFRFYGYLIVDQDACPMEALKKSSALTAGVKWPLLLFWLAITGINLLGVLCLGIGLFATVPTTMVASAHVYRSLLAQTESLPATAAPTGGPEA